MIYKSTQIQTSYRNVPGVLLNLSKTIKYCVIQINSQQVLSESVEVSFCGKFHGIKCQNYNSETDTLKNSFIRLSVRACMQSEMKLITLATTSTNYNGSDNLNSSNITSSKQCKLAQKKRSAG